MECKFGENVKALRKENNISQERLGREMNVTGATVSRWEAEKVEPDYRTLMRLAKYFGVTTDYLLGLED